MGCTNTKSRKQSSTILSFIKKPKNSKYLAFRNQYKDGIPQLQNISVSTILQRRIKYATKTI
ncbi:unnamed protein product [Paramecium sonneborni]|uniref:Uncharacterized protein n=1 Tax=Paramecium sonneborni TaxID=65129 RepID=A0A8S1K5M8_9CILI|nr:unnamed protein product [Paramecium sonneborni]